MAEKKPFGQSIDDAIKGGIRNIYENESAQAFGRGLINNPLSKGIMQYVVDPVAELGTRAASAKGILPFLPESSLLSLLTPEVTMDRQTREEMTEDISQYPVGERITRQLDRAKYDLGAFGEFIFGDVRKAGESLNQGIKFADLPPEQKMASRFFLLDILPIPGVGPATKAGAKATRELENLQALKSRMVTSDGSVGAAAPSELMTEQIRNTVGPISDEELQYLSTAFFNFPAKQRNMVHGLLDEMEKEKFAGFLKEKATPEMFPGRVKIENGIKYFRNDGAKGNQTFLPEDQIYINILESEGNKGIIKFNRATEGPPLLKNLKSQMNKKLEGVDPKDLNAIHNIFRETYLNTTGRTIDNTPGGKATGTHLLSTIKKYNATNPEVQIPLAQDAKMYRASKRVGSDVELADYYEQNITDKKQGKVALKNEDPEYRFFSNVKRTTPDLKTPQEFFGNYKLEDIRPGGKLHDKFLQFEAIDKIRLDAAKDLKPILRKIFKQVREDSLKDFPVKRDVDTITSLNLAHKFETQGIANKYVSPDKYGKGADPAELYIDISEYNSVIQRGYEEEARKLYARYADKGDEIDFQKLQEIDKEMKILGIEGEIAPGQKIGQAMPIDQKISEIMIEAMNKNYVTQTDVNKAITAVNKIAKTKKQNAKLFEGSDIIEKAQGGLVEPVKASTGGFFSRLFGKAKFREEGMNVSDIYNPTAAQRTKLEELYPGMAFPEKIDGQVYYSNLDTALRKQNAPQVFNTQKELTDYFNASGVGVDEVYDAKLDSYIKAKTDRGLPLLSNEMLQISNESPLREVYFDAYGFRSDKYNKSNAYKDSNYNQGLNSGFLPNTYRERVLRIPFTALRGDPGKSPGVGSHTFGGQYGDQRDNYMIAWSRQTDRPAFILPGETVDAQSGKIVSPKGVADKTKLQNIENKIQKLGQDPIATLNIVDDVFDARDTQAVMTAVKDLVEKSNGRINNNRAMQIILGQAKEKKKQIKKLQTQYNEEAQRIDDFKPAKKQEVTATVVEELQSDLSQAATKKARDLALKLKVMADQNIPLESMRDNELLTYFQQTKDTGGYGVSRPVGASRLELQSQYDQLMDLQRELTALARQRPYQMNVEQINFYRDKVKGQQTAIIDTMVEAISKDLMSQLYADVPLKNRLQWADAVFKQAVAEAWHRKFIEKDPNAPSFIGIQSGINRRDMWTQDGSTATSIEDRARDKQRRIDNFTNAVASGRDASLERTQYPGVGTDEFYGGPLTVTPEGTHYTGVGESIMKKLANDYNSRVVILNSATSNPTSTNYFKIINQDTGADVGIGDTYRQAENIANDLVDKEGGRYKIERTTEKVYDTEPIFGIELTPEMGQLFKIYK
tara:strand:+ start:294 stop:4367 length:4074 start_codon:yes stop_codon:yes gene_type:complete